MVVGLENLDLIEDLEDVLCLGCMLPVQMHSDQPGERWAGKITDSGSVVCDNCTETAEAATTVEIEFGYGTPDCQNCGMDLDVALWPEDGMETVDGYCRNCGMVSTYKVDRSMDEED